MLALYSKDLRWKVIFLAKILDLELKQVRNKFMQFIYMKIPPKILCALNVQDA